MFLFWVGQLASLIAILQIFSINRADSGQLSAESLTTRPSCLPAGMAATLPKIGGEPKTTALAMVPLLGFRPSGFAEEKEGGVGVWERAANNVSFLPYFKFLQLFQFLLVP